jgi:catechol 2,3-dioxygenase-like lactoylglutathione lyase family enzyme
MVSDVGLISATVNRLPSPVATTSVVGIAIFISRTFYYGFLLCFRSVHLQKVEGPRSAASSSGMAFSCLSVYRPGRGCDGSARNQPRSCRTFFAFFLAGAFFATAAFGAAVVAFFTDAFGAAVVAFFAAAAAFGDAVFAFLTGTAMVLLLCQQCQQHGMAFAS